MSQDVTEKEYSLPYDDVHYIGDDDEGYPTFEREETAPQCPYCAAEGKGIQPYTTHNHPSKLVKDIDEDGNPWTYRINLTTYRCGSCGKFFQDIQGVGRVSDRLKEKIARESFNSSSTELKQQYNISSTTVQESLNYILEKFEAEEFDHYPKVLGIATAANLMDPDEPIQNRYMIFDAEKEVLLDIQYEMPDLIQTLKSYGKPRKIIISDMIPFLIELMRNLYPDAEIIIDWNTFINELECAMIDDALRYIDGLNLNRSQKIRLRKSWDALVLENHQTYKFNAHPVLVTLRRLWIELTEIDQLQVNESMILREQIEAFLDDMDRLVYDARINPDGFVPTMVTTDDLPHTSETAQRAKTLLDEIILDIHDAKSRAAYSLGIEKLKDTIRYSYRKKPIQTIKSTIFFGSKGAKPFDMVYEKDNSSADNPHEYRTVVDVKSYELPEMPKKASKENNIQYKLSVLERRISQS